MTRTETHSYCCLFLSEKFLNFSHEKKKKYLAELNSRCRGLYQRPGLGQYGSCQYPWTINNRSVETFIGPDFIVYSDATRALLCHKEPAQASY